MRPGPPIGRGWRAEAFGEFATPNNAASDTDVRAVDRGREMDGVPVLLPADGDGADLSALLARLDLWTASS